MADGIAVPAFYLLVGVIWAFIRFTKPRQRQSMLEWGLIAVFSFGACGFVYELVSAPR